MLYIPTHELLQTKEPCVDIQYPSIMQYHSQLVTAISLLSVRGLADSLFIDKQMFVSRISGLIRLLMQQLTRWFNPVSRRKKKEKKKKSANKRKRKTQQPPKGSCYNCT